MPALSADAEAALIVGGAFVPRAQRMWAYFAGRDGPPTTWQWRPWGSGFVGGASRPATLERQARGTGAVFARRKRLPSPSLIPSIGVHQWPNLLALLCGVDAAAQVGKPVPPARPCGVVLGVHLRFRHAGRGGPAHSGHAPQRPRRPRRGRGDSIVPFWLLANGKDIDAGRDAPPTISSVSIGVHRWPNLLALSLIHI